MLTNISAKRILCFGDSNTWGQHPSVRTRFTANERWTALLQRALGEDFDVIEEGLSSRTIDLDYLQKPGRNGKTYFLPCLLSQHPLDGVVIMLGTNDCKTEFNRSAEQIAESLRGLIKDARLSSPQPKILIMSPVPINAQAPDFAAYRDTYYNQQSAETSKQLADAYKKIAAAEGCTFFDAGSTANVGSDGVHLTAQGHAALAEALARVIKEWL